MQALVNPRRACAARVTVLDLCVSFSATARNIAPKKIYQQLQRDMSKVLKMLGSEVMASFAYRGSVRRCCSDP